MLLIVRGEAYEGKKRTNYYHDSCGAGYNNSNVYNVSII